MPQIPTHKHSGSKIGMCKSSKHRDNWAKRSSARTGPSLAKHYHFAASSTLPLTVVLKALQIEHGSHSRALSCVPQACKLSPIFSCQHRTWCGPAVRPLAQYRHEGWQQLHTITVVSQLTDHHQLVASYLFWLFYLFESSTSISVSYYLFILTLEHGTWEWVGWDLIAADLS